MVAVTLQVTVTFFIVYEELTENPLFLWYKILSGVEYVYKGMTKYERRNL